MRKVIRACEKKIQVRISCLWLVSRPPKSGCFFGKFTVKQTLKSFPGRKKSLKCPVFGFSNSFLYGLEESRELRFLISWFLE